MPIEILAALIGLGAVILSVGLSRWLRIGVGDRRHAQLLREYLTLRDSDLQLDAQQREKLDFEIAWCTVRLLGPQRGFKGGVFQRIFGLGWGMFVGGLLGMFVGSFAVTAALPYVDESSWQAGALLLGYVMLVLLGPYLGFRLANDEERRELRRWRAQQKQSSAGTDQGRV